ncbi:WecB/TagA/CpsF family glycosyltransferase [Bacteroidota bacterium]
MEKFMIGDIAVNSVGYDDIVALISLTIEQNGKSVIHYVNAASAVMFRKNPDLQDAIYNADLLFPDGTGIFLAAKVLYKNGFKERFNWTDNAYRFIRESEKQGWRLFFLGATRQVINKAVAHLEKEYPDLQIVGYADGYEDVKRIDLIKDINSSKPNIIWVGMGTPRQEIWIDNNKDLIECNIFQSVGDIFTFFTGEKIRGPKVIMRLGFEWLARLIGHPILYFRRYVMGIPLFVFWVMEQLVNRLINRQR